MQQEWRNEPLRSYPIVRFSLQENQITHEERFCRFKGTSSSIFLCWFGCFLCRLGRLDGVPLNLCWITGLTCDLPARVLFLLSFESVFFVVPRPVPVGLDGGLH